MQNTYAKKGRLVSMQAKKYTVQTFTFTKKWKNNADYQSNLKLS